MKNSGPFFHIHSETNDPPVLSLIVYDAAENLLSKHCQKKKKTKKKQKKKNDV